MDEKVCFGYPKAATTKIKNSPELNTTATQLTSELNELSDEEKLLFSPFKQQNLTLKIGNEKLSVNKEHLMAVSAVFNRMLQSDFKEGTANEISLPGKKLGHFIRFLRHILPGFDDKLTEDTVHYLLPLADEYQTERFLRDIESFLVNSTNNPSGYDWLQMQTPNPIPWIIEAEKYNLTKYLDACINVAIKRKHKNLMTDPKYSEISLITRNRISTTRVKEIETMYEALIVKNYHSLSNKEKVKDFMDRLKSYMS